VIHVVDRLSRRHNWQVVTRTDLEKRATIVEEWLKRQYLDWSGRDSYPGYQIGRIELEGCQTDSLPRNADVEVWWDARI